MPAWVKTALTWVVILLSFWLILSSRWGCSTKVCIQDRCKEVSLGD